MMKLGNSYSQKGNAALVILLIVLALIAGGVFYYSTQKREVEGPIQEITEPEQIETETETSEIETQTPETETQLPTEGEVEGEPLPEKDAVGTKDLDIVGRYPGSVLVRFDRDEDRPRTTVEYVTKAETDEVKEYYIDLLEDEGWEIETVDDDEMRLFNEDLGTLFIRFYYDERDLTLTYTLEHLPESNY